ncbi:gcn5-related n-acetyltransferase [Acrodontium crateriforme]|uniref:Gcn5-related n-acetyltransferase n=1 Tax=Acrodontium crateriforme TaxID=150365 RepID=A0AAQ3RDL9_9PEZI|nr:gcn5-related n-acetyltransferase [Acrodontium crateriforme]
MPSIASGFKRRTWHPDGYFVSTNHQNIPLQILNDVLASPPIYWAKGLPLDMLEETLQQSLCFGLFRNDLNVKETQRLSNAENFQQSDDEENLSLHANTTDEPSSRSVLTEKSFIGFARCITDFTTFSYLKHVWVD